MCARDVNLRILCAHMRCECLHNTCTNANFHIHMVRVKNNVTICKICALLFDKKSCRTFMKIAPHFYGLCGKHRDTELRHFLPNVQQFLPNVPQFGKRATFSGQKAPHTPHFQGKRRRTRHIFRAKGAAIQGLWCFTRRRTVARPSKCGAFAIKVWHFWWEKSNTNAAMFSSSAAACVAFFLTRTILYTVRAHVM